MYQESPSTTTTTTTTENRIEMSKSVYRRGSIQDNTSQITMIGRRREWKRIDPEQKLSDLPSSSKNEKPISFFFSCCNDLNVKKKTCQLWSTQDDRDKDREIEREKKPRERERVAARFRVVMKKKMKKMKKRCKFLERDFFESRKKKKSFYLFCLGGWI